jgi:cation:H+ antiporter
LVHPIPEAGIAVVDLAVMVALAVVLLPFMRSGFRLVRWEGVVLLLIYVGYVVYLVP